MDGSMKRKKKEEKKIKENKKSEGVFPSDDPLVLNKKCEQQN